ncbi:hypothetical protein BRADI_2g41476v3 [Brachypodium distachyon]|uniref:Uncharacterized protein n=1 Tax=Brachypodium distachyon TaxID=15368 RepID=A0A2K2DD69_BRADI|nr:hypothetical protein BRADI_2g41476v3 [Brachypodium distachyon]
MDAETEAYYQDHGVDPWILELNLITALTCLNYILPNPTSFVSSNGVSALHNLPLPQVDRISRLPDMLLIRIVSSLPVKEGACTALLSRCWRGVWRAAPLVLADAVASAISGILAGHQGPIRCARLISCYMKEIPGLLLFLFNRPWPLNMQLPVGFFGIATLTRLYLGVFTFPDTAALLPAIQFPHLCELGLFCMTMENRDMDFVLARTPVLKTLCIQMNILLTCLRIISRSLRCVHIIGGTDLDVVMEDAPQLERLIMWSSCVRNGLPRKVKIGFAPALTVLGYLEPALHTLEIGNTVIKDGTRASWSTMVPSVKILALRVRFHNNAKMMSSFLRCFPNVKRLHLEPDHETVEQTSKLHVKFWQEGGAIECVQSHMEVMIFCGFRGAPNEISFLQYILESARMLTKLVIVFSKGSFTSKTKGNKKLKPLFTGKWANKDCSLMPVESAVKDDRFLLNIESAFDFSIKDPFTEFGYLA